MTYRAYNAPRTRHHQPACGGRLSGPGDPRPPACYPIGSAAAKEALRDAWQRAFDLEPPDALDSEEAAYRAQHADLVDLDDWQLWREHCRAAAAWGLLPPGSLEAEWWGERLQAVVAEQRRRAAGGSR